MHISIREGSAARNLVALMPLLVSHPDRVMLCTDDMHPDRLVSGHINILVARCVAAGIDLFNVLRAACLNPIDHYGLPVGRLRVGDPADLILVRDLEQFEVLRTWIRGSLTADAGKSLIPPIPTGRPNRFNCRPIHVDALRVNAKDDQVLAMEAVDGQLITHKRFLRGRLVNGELLPDKEKDLLKIVVLNRYQNAPPAVGWIRHFGLKRGAIASSVAHDSHNIVAVGTNDDDLCSAINAIVAARGGVSLADGQHVELLPLPVAGLMSDEDPHKVAQAYASLDRAAKALGSTLEAPFMTLSFMALLVIPHLKMSDRGLFDGDEMCLVDAPDAG